MSQRLKIKSLVPFHGANFHTYLLKLHYLPFPLMYESKIEVAAFLLKNRFTLDNPISKFNKITVISEMIGHYLVQSIGSKYGLDLEQIATESILTVLDLVNATNCHIKNLSRAEKCKSKMAPKMASAR